jgi:predicted transcriptional regulator
MKTAITVRLDPDLLEAVGMGAERENRTLTNFVATAVEDDEVAEVTGEMLDAIGLDVTRATGAQAALDVLSGDQRFSLIF